MDRNHWWFSQKMDGYCNLITIKYLLTLRYKWRGFKRDKDGLKSKNDFQFAKIIFFFNICNAASRFTKLHLFFYVWQFMSKQKKSIAQPKSQVASRTAGTKTKTPALSTGWYSMTNWLAALLFILPFLYSQKVLDTAVSVRYIFLCSFMLLFVIYFFIWQKRAVAVPSLLIRIVFITGAAFAVWSLVSLAVAINYHEGYYEISRHLLHLVLLFIIMTTVTQEPSALLKICCIVTLVALMQGIVGILQFYEIAFTELPGNYKPYAFMTNRNLFGSAQALVLPFALYVFYAGKKYWKIIAAAACIAIIISLVLSQTRSSWLAGIAILISSTILVLFFVPALRKKWMIASLATVVIIAAIVSVLIFTDKEGGLAKSVTERAASLAVKTSSGSDAEVNISERLKMLKKTISIIKDHPFTGVGAGNWKVVIPSYGLDSTVYAKGFFAPDRVHNMYLQIASETGVPGAVFYFGMWLMIAWIGFKTIRTTNDDNKKVLVILMLAGFTAIAIDSMFSFAAERIEHSLYMLLMAGVILGLYAETPPTAISKMNRPKKVVLLPVVLLILFNLLLAKKKYDFEKHLKLSVFYNESRRFAETINEVKKGKNEFFTIDVTGNPLEMYSGVAYKELKNNDAAIAEFKTAVAYSPYNNRIYNNQATVYWELKQYQTAIDNYKKALVYAPEFETILKNLAMTYYQAGQYKECVATIEKLKIENDPLLINVLNDCRRKLAENQ